MNYKIVMSDELEHHGILGQKWGVRRYQNKDGSLTSEGKKRYEVDYKRSGARVVDSETGKKMTRGTKKALVKSMKKDDKKLYKEYKYNERISKSDKVVGVGSTSAVTTASVISAANSGSAKIGKQRCAEILSDYGNKYLNDLSKSNKLPEKYGDEAYKAIKNNKQLKKAYNTAQNELYKKYGDELEKYAYGETQDSKAYYNTVNKIQDEAYEIARKKLNN